MSQSFDPCQFPDLLPWVLMAFVAPSAALEETRFEASVERAARQREKHGEFTADPDITATGHPMGAAPVEQRPHRRSNRTGWRIRLQAFWGCCVRPR
jgi:hypothetical protein